MIPLIGVAIPVVWFLRLVLQPAPGRQSSKATVQATRISERLAALCNLVPKTAIAVRRNATFQLVYVNCSSDTDCTGNNVCGVANPDFIGFLACGQLTGCTTAKGLCGIGQYFTGGTTGDSCTDGTDCASLNCPTVPAKTCSVNSDCAAENG